MHRVERQRQKKNPQDATMRNVRAERDALREVRRMIRALTENTTSEVVKIRDDIAKIATRVEELESWQRSAIITRRVG